jgi:hypothetical protein
MAPQTKPAMDRPPPGGKFTAAGFEDDDIRAIGDTLIGLPSDEASQLLKYLRLLDVIEDKRFDDPPIQT